MSSSSDGRNDLLAKTLRKTPKNGSIQGTGKFVTPFLYFDTSRSCDPMEKDRLKLEDWLVKHNAKIEELRKEIRRKPRHSDINSPNTPMKGDYMHDGDLETNVEATVSKHELKSTTTSPKKNGGNLEKRNDSPNKKKHKTTRNIFEDFGKLPETSKKIKSSLNKKRPKIANNKLGDFGKLLETLKKRKGNPNKKSPETANTIL
ncbi:hypothetical protein WN943_001201 [Citrus x changshan-huyou]